MTMPAKLLLADDSVTIQRVIELTFADEDIDVVAVGDGKQAIARVQTDRPDIVLADVGMPEQDGYQVAAFIKGNPELAHIPVLLLTGAFEPIDETRARAVGCDGVLVKPFEPQMVITRVKDLLAGRRPRGLWAVSPVVQKPAGQPAPAAATAASSESPGAVKPQASPASLEDYFDRLDAAFASLESGAPPPAEAAASPGPAPVDSAHPPVQPQAGQASSPMDELAGWDPDLTGGPPRKPADEAEPPRAVVPAPALVPLPAPMLTPPSAAQIPPPAPVVQPSAPRAQDAASADPVPSLAEAFAALLAAERGQPVPPSQIRPGMISDEVIDDIVGRVTERMNERAVRDTVVDVAERLVRDEIARIKASGK